MIRQFYVDATAWVDADPEIARFIVADIACYVETERTAPGVPFCDRLIRSHVIDRSTETARVLDAWEKNSDVLAYLAPKGYNPAAQGPKDQRDSPTNKRINARRNRRAI